MELILEYALRFVGIPYKWGGKNPLEGLDCSGFVQLLLRSAGILPSSPILSAQQICIELMNNGGKKLDKPQLGAIAFFGKGMTSIDHVGFCVDEMRMIEARGGDHTTMTLKDAEAKGAFVELRPLHHRADLVTIVLPDYSSVSLS